MLTRSRSFLLSWALAVSEGGGPEHEGKQTISDDRWALMNGIRNVVTFVKRRDTTSVPQYSYCTSALSLALNCVFAIQLTPDTPSNHENSLGKPLTYPSVVSISVSHNPSSFMFYTTLLCSIAQPIYIERNTKLNPSSHRLRQQQPPTPSRKS